MRSIKKIAALVLTFAMLATMFAFSASAETEAAKLYLDGPKNATQGQVYTVSICLEDKSDLVGGFSGTLTYSGATVEDIQVHPSVLALNDATEASTIITDKGNGTINFVTVTRVNGVNPQKAVWFKVQFTIDGDANFALSGVTFSDKEGKAYLSQSEGTVGQGLVLDVAAKNYAIDEIKIKDTADATKQGLGYAVSFPGGKIPDNATEYGVIFLPTNLLEEGKALTEDNYSSAVAAKVNKDTEPARFASSVENGTYWAYLSFNFASEDKAYQFLGTKISARAYYKIGNDIYYSDNTNGIGVEDGVADKAVLNVAKELANSIADQQTQAVKDALADLDGPTTYKANRGTLLQFVTDNF